MKKNLPANKTDFILYTSASGDVKADVLLNDETAWLTQKNMAVLFDVKVPGINKHLKNIFNSGELDENSVISILETTAMDGNMNMKFTVLTRIKILFPISIEKSGALRGKSMKAKYIIPAPNNRYIIYCWAVV